MYQYNNSQRGQAMAEYMVLIPAAIMIAVAAGLIGRALYGSLDKITDVVRDPYLCQAEPNPPEPSSNEGPTFATMGNHSVELVNKVYSSVDNTTTVTYRVTSGARPSISHWTLGLPDWMADNVVSISEGNTEWGVDPTTGVGGLKFDTGYEVNGGKPEKEPKKKVAAATIASSEETATVSRDITMMFNGQYDYGETDVAIKAGTDTYTETITAPKALKAENPENDQVECN
jgi:hypothetical protein